MILAYICFALAVSVAGRHVVEIRNCGIAIAACLAATKCVTVYFDGVEAHVLWSSIWCLGAVLCVRQMWCSVLLFASGLCYIPAYLVGFVVGPGATVSIVADLLGLAALLTLGGRVIAEYLDLNSLSRFLGMGYPRIRPSD